MKQILLLAAITAAVAAASSCSKYDALDSLTVMEIDLEVTEDGEISVVR